MLDVQANVTKQAENLPDSLSDASFSIQALLIEYFMKKTN